MVTCAYTPNWTYDYILNKKNEQKKIDNILKATRFNLDFPSVKLNTIPHGKLNKKIMDIVDEVKPDIIYTHWEHDINLDHNIIFKSCMVATRPPRNINLFCFETVSESEWNTVSFSPNMWIDISDTIIEKLDLFSLYESEVKPNPHPRSLKNLHTLAYFRGSQICKDCVEAFNVVKLFDFPFF